MWTQISFLYFSVVFGIYCFALPSASLALRKMKFPGSKDLRILSSEISNNKFYTNKEFKALVKPMLIPRMPDTEGSTKVRQYIEGFLRKLNWDIEEDQFQDSTPYGLKTFTNIIATFEPEVKNKLVLACHYDSKNISTSSGRFFIGATDSAVPCAIMLDIAKKLDCSLRQKRDKRKRSVSEDVTLQLMFFDGEEAYQTWSDTDSLYGSRHLARKLKITEDPFYPGTSRLDNIELFVLLDLIGTADISFQSFDFGAVDYFRWLTNMEDSLRNKGFLNNNGLEKKRILFTKHRPWSSIEDDHRPFMKESPKLPVLHLISAPFPTVWHQMEDDESAINYDVTDNVNRIIRVFTASYLNAPATTCRH